MEARRSLIIEPWNQITDIFEHDGDNQSDF